MAAPRTGGSISPTVLVVGAGPVGLAAAIELARRGATVRLIEKLAEPSALSKAVGINPRTLELLEPSGVTPLLLEAGLRVPHVHLRYEGEALATVDLGRIDHRYNFMLSLPQDETEAVLGDAAGAAGVTVERGVELTEVVPEDDGVGVHIVQNGQTGTVAFDYLLGCDGAHSAVRKSAGLDFTGERYPDTWSLADIRMDWPHGHGEGHLLMRRDGKILFVLSMPGGRFRAISNSGHVLDLLPSGSDVGEILWQTDFTVSLRQAARYRAGRVFLAGDAAHIHSPAGGRGMNLGIEDAAVFTRRLFEGGLESYSDDRHRVGAQVVRESDVQFRLAAMRNPIARTLRNFVIRHVLGAEAVQRPFRLRMAGLDHPAM